jgi:DNA phosphorothioation-dependent restriction protein DptH
MSTGFQELQENQVIQALEALFVPHLKEILGSRGRGHCMRIADLQLNLAVALTRTLRREVPDAGIFILGDSTVAVEPDLLVSSTKLVELRNPLPDGSLRSPLLVFLPPNLQTNAEDSFNVASFEEIFVADVYDKLFQTLLQRVTAPLQGYIREICENLRREKWNWADPLGRSRFLLTGIENGNEGETFGAALYELGLVPDFHLFDDPSITLGRINKNLESMQKLTFSLDKSIRGRVLDLELNSKTVQNRLVQFLVDVGVEDPRRWTRQIVLQRGNWDISFDKWEFSNQVNLDRISIEIQSIDLPEVKEDVSDPRLQSLIGSQVLDPKTYRKFKVEFQVEPHPKQVDGLSYFTVQIVSQEGGSVGTAKKVKQWQTKSPVKSVTLDKLDKFEFEEGWHFVRVLPWTENGDPIPLEDPASWRRSNSSKSYESELFYVLPNAELNEEPPQRAIPLEASLEHARLKLQFTAISERRNPEDINYREVLWVDKNNARTTAPESLEVKFGREGKIRIPVSHGLKLLEQKILSSPEQPISWQLPIHLTQLGTPVPEIVEWFNSTAVASFLSARSRYFAAIRSDKQDLVSQAADFTQLKGLVYDYAQTYQELLMEVCRRVERGSDQQALTDLKKVLAIDSIRLTLVDFRGKVREAILIGPTHPLRALWLVTWSQVSQSWVTAARNCSEEFIGPTRDGIRSLVPLNMPAMIPLLDGRVFATIDNIHPFWSLYAPATQEDTRGLVGEVCAALGLSEPESIGGTAITKEVLASRIERYLAQHPYIRTLSINALNPGRAVVLAEALILLQRQEAFKNLRYDIRLFVSDSEAPGVGEALEQLLAPSSAVSSEADAFSSSTGTHLFPKLNLAIHSTEADFRQQPALYSAHLSFLFDLFPSEEVGSAPTFQTNALGSLHGLIQDFSVQFQDDESGALWRRQPSYGRPSSLPDVDDLIDLLSDIPRLISVSTASVSTGVPSFENRPVISLGLNTEQRALLHSIHQVSDWVFTIDRNIGIEFFDHGGRHNRSPYLVDYVPNSTASFGHRLVITSRSLLELESILFQVLHQYGLKAEGNHLTAILEQLRSLSGRLALKLISSSSQQAEVLGLALARLFLKYQGALSNQIILPLDAHLELFRAAKQQADELGESVSLQRTDLALFDLNAETRTIRCNLVEVKCYAQVGGLANYSRLKEGIAEQISQSEAVLRLHFEPSDRPDRLLKTREFAILLRFYLERSSRYGLIEPDVFEEAHFLLSTLEEGYTLEFSKSGLIFDFQKSGADDPEYEAGIEFHRIGIDLIKLMVETAKPSTSDISEDSETEVTQSPLPQLPSAAFLVPKRERSSTWGNVSSMERMKSFSLLEDSSQLDNKTILSSPSNTDLNQATELVEAEASDEQTPLEEADSNSVEFVEVENVKVVAQSNDDTGLNPPLIQPINSSIQSDLPFDIMLGVQSSSPQYGILGETSGRKVALDLNQTHTIGLFGVQGAGKSYTLGTIIEMACTTIPNINVLPSPLATVVFHYSPTSDYKPEFTSMMNPNSEIDQLAVLRDRYSAAPSALKDIVILVPKSKVEERKVEYPGIEVLPITFASSELKAHHWKFLMGAVGSQSMYLRQINLIMRRKPREELTLPDLLQSIENSSLSDHLKDLARTRLEFASEYIDDNHKLVDVIRPGRLIIVDLRDEYIEKDEALGLFVVMLQIFSEATYQEEAFNKLVVFDEAHKYIESPDLITGLVEVVREMRHKGTSIMVASQDPPSVPTSLIELSSQIILHRFNSPAWLKHIQKANAALDNLNAQKMSQLGPGEAFIWSSKATDVSFTQGALKIRCRPRVTQHGGSTKTAV